VKRRPHIDDHVQVNGFETPAVRVLEHCTASGARLDANSEVLPHLAFIHVCFLAEGAIEERRGAKRVVRVAPNLRASPSWDSHRLHCGSAHARCLYIQVPTDASEPSEWPDDVIFSNDPRLTHLAAQLEFETHQGDFASPLEIEAMATELLGRMKSNSESAHCPRPPAWVLRVRDLLEDCYVADLDITDLAGEAGVHRVHLARVFRAHFGTGPGEFVRRARFRRARELLLRTTLPLAQVALEAGFCDQSHLVRATRRALNMTPGALRRLANGERPTAPAD
jgi:AraC-like DNA-binding protein